MQQLTNGTLLQGGKYKIARFISAGGFGNTYEGVHTMMDTKVAIKEFFPKMFCNRDENTSHITVATQSNRELVDKLRKKFVEEAKSIFKMNHPNIVKVHDIFEENGSAYYVMDYIDGKSLGDIVKAHGIFSENEAVGYIRQVADALKYVHSLNRLHLDIKPGNIMVDKNGNAMLIDFGASKHYDMESGENTSTLMGVNTKGYAPVEQSTQSFTKFSPATDIYALGATLYKLITGITPPDANLLLAGEETLEQLPSKVSVSTRNAVSAAMSLKRADRPQSIDDFLTILNVQASSNADDEETIFVGGNNEQTEIEQQVEGCKENAPSLKNQQSRSHTTIAMCADFFKKSHIALSVLWGLNLILRFYTIYWFQPWAWFYDDVMFNDVMVIMNHAFWLVYLFTGVYGLYKIIQFKKIGLFFAFIGSILSPFPFIESKVLIEGDGWCVLSDCAASVTLVLLLFASMSIKKNGVSYYDCLKAKK